MTKIIAIANHKGGVGKTASTLSIGVGLSKLGKKILLVDIDAQANLSQSLGVEEPDKEIYGALKGDYKAAPILIEEEGVDLLPATLDLSGAELELAAVAGREFILKEVLEPLKKNYDYILIDCPPSLSLLTLNAFVSADRIFVPVQTHYLPVRGLIKLIEVIEIVKNRLNPTLDLAGIFMTLYEGGTVLHKESAKSIESTYPDLVFKTKIRKNIAIAETPLYRQSIYRSAPDSNGAKDYLALSKEILDRLNK